MFALLNVCSSVQPPAHIPMLSWISTSISSPSQKSSDVCSNLPKISDIYRKLSNFTQILPKFTQIEVFSAYSELREELGQ
jgi:hypothetical protein